MAFVPFRRGVVYPSLGNGHARRTRCRSRAFEEDTSGERHRRVAPQTSKGLSFANANERRRLEVLVKSADSGASFVIGKSFPVRLPLLFPKHHRRHPKLLAKLPPKMRRIRKPAARRDIGHRPV